jgi:hypothetical protein
MRTAHRRLMALLPPTLLLAACQDQPLPTALAPGGAAFDQEAGACVVTSSADDGEGSLRHAINTAACTNITFGVVGSITLTSGQLTIDRDLTINDPGESMSVSGNNASRVFQINPGRTVALSGLMIVSGYTSFSDDTFVGCGGLTFNGCGGGILNGGMLTLTNSTVSSNSADYGGGIFNHYGTLTLTNSTVWGNSADDGGGGIYDFWGTLTLTNSTVWDNSADYGGGIFNDYGVLTLASSTVSDNSANYGGGIGNRLGDMVGMRTVTLTNTIVANSASGGNCGGPIIDGGFNLDSGSSCGFTTANHSLSNTDPMLGWLTFNGGPTPTLALLAGSPAIGAGNPDFDRSSVLWDQRGRGYPRQIGQRIDIGAFEFSRAR